MSAGRRIRVSAYGKVRLLLRGYSDQEVSTDLMMLCKRPQHSHSATQNLSVSLPAVTTTGTTNQPGPSVAPAAPTDAARNPVNIYSNATPNQNLGKPSISGSITIGLTGNGLPHENRQPYLAVNYIIALQGFFPSRG